jgi:hypothetical protein
MNSIWTSEAPRAQVARRTLHSWPYWVLSRYFVLAPAGLMAKMGYLEACEHGITALGPYVFPALLVVFIALVIRMSTPRVYATNAGMEVRHVADRLRSRSNHQLHRQAKSAENRGYFSERSARIASVQRLSSSSIVRLDFSRASEPLKT